MADQGQQGPAGGGKPLIKITRPVDEIRAVCGLSEAGQAALEPEMIAAAIVDRLCGHGLWKDAVQFLAHALPKREAVWWACLAARTTLGEAPPEAPPRRAVEAAEAWVYQPSEQTRRAAEAAARPKPDAAPRWAAFAAAWSGGSMAPPEAPTVPPGETQTARAVIGAVVMAALRPGGDRAPATYRGLIAQAVDIARGGSGRVADGGDHPAAG